MAVGIGFDAEGTPKRRHELVKAGVTSGLVHDRRTAKALGATSTGNAVAGAGPFGALPANLTLEPGSESPDALIGAVERGLLVTDFWYTRILDPRTMVVTGLTRNGVWLVEGRTDRPSRHEPALHAVVSRRALARRGARRGVRFHPGQRRGLRPRRLRRSLAAPRVPGASPAAPRADAR